MSEAKTRKIVVAIDGYSGSGKSTMAKSLARTVGYAYIDTGAMYRTVALYCLEAGIMRDSEIDTARLQSELPDVKIGFVVGDDGKTHATLNGRDVESEIRSMRVSGKVSLVAALPFVREEMVRQQQAMGEDKGIVMDGRDIGTVVFPDAELKVFVNAPAETRAMRRFKELQEKGDTITFEQVLENVKERDRIDTTRETSPLRKASDAIELDNSGMTLEEQDQWLLERFREAIEIRDKR